VVVGGDYSMSGKVDERMFLPRVCFHRYIVLL